MAKSTKGKILYAYALKGFNIKLICDSLAMSMKRTSFNADKNGIFHRDSDENVHICYDISLPRDCFRRYHCTKNLSFSLNLKHLAKILKDVKKKDSVILYINEDKENILYITIYQTVVSEHDNKKRTSSIVINFDEEKKESFELPEMHKFVNEGGDGEEIPTYGYAMTVDSQDFQGIKKVTGMGKVMNLKIQKNNYICFHSENTTL